MDNKYNKVMIIKIMNDRMKIYHYRMKTFTMIKFNKNIDIYFQKIQMNKFQFILENKVKNSCIIRILDFIPNTDYIEKKIRLINNNYFIEPASTYLIEFSINESFNNLTNLNLMIRIKEEGEDVDKYCIFNFNRITVNQNSYLFEKLCKNFIKKDVEKESVNNNSNDDEEEEENKNIIEIKKENNPNLYCCEMHRMKTHTCSEASQQIKKLLDKLKITYDLEWLGMVSMMYTYLGEEYGLKFINYFKQLIDEPLKLLKPEECDDEEKKGDIIKLLRLIKKFVAFHFCSEIDQLKECRDPYIRNNLLYHYNDHSEDKEEIKEIEIKEIETNPIELYFEKFEDIILPDFFFKKYKGDYFVDRIEKELKITNGFDEYRKEDYLNICKEVELKKEKDKKKKTLFEVVQTNLKQKQENNKIVEENPEEDTFDKNDDYFEKEGEEYKRGKQKFKNQRNYELRNSLYFKSKKDENERNRNGYFAHYRNQDIQYDQMRKDNSFRRNKNIKRKPIPKKDDKQSNIRLAEIFEKHHRLDKERERKYKEKLEHREKEFQKFIRMRSKNPEPPEEKEILPVVITNRSPFYKKEYQYHHLSEERKRQMKKEKNRMGLIENISVPFDQINKDRSEKIISINKDACVDKEKESKIVKNVTKEMKIRIKNRKKKWFDNETKDIDFSKKKIPVLLKKRETNNELVLQSEVVKSNLKEQLKMYEQRKNISNLKKQEDNKDKKPVYIKKKPENAESKESTKLSTWNENSVNRKKKKIQGVNTINLNERKILSSWNENSKNRKKIIIEEKENNNNPPPIWNENKKSGKWHEKHKIEGKKLNSIKIDFLTSNNQKNKIIKTKDAENNIDYLPTPKLKKVFKKTAKKMTDKNQPQENWNENISIVMNVPTIFQQNNQKVPKEVEKKNIFMETSWYEGIPRHKLVRKENEQTEEGNNDDHIECFSLIDKNIFPGHKRMDSSGLKAFRAALEEDNDEIISYSLESLKFDKEFSSFDLKTEDKRSIKIGRPIKNKNCSFNNGIFLSTYGLEFVNSHEENTVSIKNNSNDSFERILLHSEFFSNYYLKKLKIYKNEVDSNTKVLIGIKKGNYLRLLTFIDNNQNNNSIDFNFRKKKIDVNVNFEKKVKDINDFLSENEKELKYGSHLIVAIKGSGIITFDLEKAVKIIKKKTYLEDNLKKNAKIKSPFFFMSDTKKSQKKYNYVKDEKVHTIETQNDENPFFLDGKSLNNYINSINGNKLHILSQCVPNKLKIKAKVNIKNENESLFNFFEESFMSLKNNIMGRSEQIIRDNNVFTKERKVKDYYCCNKKKKIGCKSGINRIYSKDRPSIEFSMVTKHTCVCPKCGLKYLKPEDKMVCIDCVIDNHFCYQCSKIMKRTSHRHHQFVHYSLHKGFQLIREQMIREAKRFFLEKEVFFKSKKRIPRSARLLVFVQLARIYQNKGEYIKCMDYLKEAYKVAVASKILIDQLIILINEGTVLRKVNNFGKAFKLMGSIVNVIKKLEKMKFKHFAIADGYEECGLILFENGKYNDAKNFFKKSLILFKKDENQLKISEVLNNISQSAFCTGKYVEAIDAIKESLEISKKVKNFFLIGVNLMNLGRIYQRIGKLKKSDIYLTKSINIFKNIKDENNNLSNVKNFMAQVNHLKGKNCIMTIDYKNGVNYFKSALKTFESLNDEFRQADITLEMACIYVKTGHKDSLKFCKKALFLATNLHSKEMIAQAHNLLGSCQTKLKNYNEGEECLLKSYNLFKELNESENVMMTTFSITMNILKRLLHDHFKNQKKKGIIRNSKLPNINKNQSCFKKAIAFLEEGFKYFDTMLFQFKTDLSSLVSFVNTKLMIISRIVVMFYRLGCIEEFVKYSDLCKSLVDCSGAKDDQLVSLKKIMGLRKDDGNLSLNYFFVPEVYLENYNKSLVFIYLISDNKVHYFKRVSINQTEFYNKICKFSKELENFEKVEIEENGNYLKMSNSKVLDKSINLQKKICSELFDKMISEKILKCIKDNIGDKKLIIYPHNFLSLVPFQCLLDKSGKYFVENFSFYILNSVFLGHICRSNFKKNKSKERELLGVTIGNPVYKTNPSLNNQDELDYIKKISKDNIPGKEILELSGEAANVKKVKKTLNKSSSHFIYFAVHGKSFEQNQKVYDNHGLSGGLLLSNDKPIFASDISDMNINSDFIFVNSCESSLGNITNSGIMGLPKAFIHSGVSLVISTQFRVNNAVAKFVSDNFFKSYFEELKTKKYTNKRKHLRKCLLKLMDLKLELKFKEEPDLIRKVEFRDLAVYWCPFILQGWDEELKTGDQEVYASSFLDETKHNYDSSVLNNFAIEDLSNPVIKFDRFIMGQNSDLEIKENHDFKEMVQSIPKTTYQVIMESCSNKNNSKNYDRYLDHQYCCFDITRKTQNNNHSFIQIPLKDDDAVSIKMKDCSQKFYLLVNQNLGDIHSFNKHENRHLNGVDQISIEVQNGVISVYYNRPDNRKLRKQYINRSNISLFIDCSSKIKILCRKNKSEKIGKRFGKKKRNNHIKGKESETASLQTWVEASKKKERKYKFLVTNNRIHKEQMGANKLMSLLKKKIF